MQAAWMWSSTLNGLTKRVHLGLIAAKSANGNALQSALLDLQLSSPGLCHPLQFIFSSCDCCYLYKKETLSLFPLSNSCPYIIHIPRYSYSKLKIPIGLSVRASLSLVQNSSLDLKVVAVCV